VGTADLLDEHGDRAQVCQIRFRSFGPTAFTGRIATVRCPEDNVLLRAGVAVQFGGVIFEPGAELHADEDGVVVLPG
jgi:regulator of ribonuclease activity A